MICGKGKQVFFFAAVNFSQSIVYTELTRIQNQVKQQDGAFCENN